MEWDWHGSYVWYLRLFVRGFAISKTGAYLRHQTTNRLLVSDVRTIEDVNRDFVLVSLSELSWLSERNTFPCEPVGQRA